MLNNKIYYDCIITAIKPRGKRFYIKFRDSGDDNGDYCGIYEMFTSSTNYTLNNSLRDLYLRDKFYMTMPMAIEFHRGRKNFIIDDIRYVTA